MKRELSEAAGPLKGVWSVQFDIKRVMKAVKTISYRKFIKQTKDATPEQLAREHLSGVRPYVSQARREQAAKTRAAAELKRVVKKIDRLDMVRNMSPNERKGGGKTWHLLPDARVQFLEDRAAKLRGEEIPVGRWHSMMDVAKAINDPALNAEGYRRGGVMNDKPVNSPMVGPSAYFANSRARFGEVSGFEEVLPIPEMTLEEVKIAMMFAGPWTLLGQTVARDFPGAKNWRIKGHLAISKWRRLKSMKHDPSPLEV